MAWMYKWLSIYSKIERNYLNSSLSWKNRMWSEISPINSASLPYWAHDETKQTKDKKQRSSAWVTRYKVCKPDSRILSPGCAGSSSAYWCTAQVYFSQNCFSCSLWGYLLSDVADTVLSVPGPHPVLPEASVLRVGDLDTMDVETYCVCFFPEITNVCRIFNSDTD